MSEQEVLGTPPEQDIPEFGEQPGLEPIESNPENETVENDASVAGEQDQDGESSEVAGQQDTDGEPKVDFKERAAKFQTRYQNTLGIAKKYLSPEQYRIFKADVDKQSVGGQLEQVEPPVSGDLKVESLWDMTPDDFITMINQSVEKSLTARQQAENQQKMQERYTQEVTECDQALGEFIKEGEFSQEEIQRAASEVKSYSIDTTQPRNYALATTLFIKELKNIEREKGLAQRATETSAEAAAKQKELLNTMQPTGGAMPETPSLNDQQKALERIRGLRPEGINKLLGT